MKRTRSASASFALFLGLVSIFVSQSFSQEHEGGLAGSTWQLVRFQSSDDTTLTPSEPSKYTVAFAAGGSVSVRFDCNRGHGTWKSAGPNQLEFGPMALTRAMCPPAPLNDRLPKDWPHVRSYTMKDGHLFLALMADGGIYEFEPVSASASGSHVDGTAAYGERMALPAGAVFDATLEDVSRADAAADVLGRAHLEHPGNPPIAFQIAYDPARIQPSHSYAVRARITVGSQLIFTTTQSYLVLTRGHGSEVKLLLQRAAGSTTNGGSDKGAVSSGPISGLPATYVGDLPCADCPGIRYQVNLAANHTYSSRMRYEERNTSFDEHGTWKISEDGKTLVLLNSRQRQQKFALIDSSTLRQLDADGHEIQSTLNYDLKRAPEFVDPVPEGGSIASISLENTEWELVDLGSAPVHAASPQQEPFLLLDSQSHRVSGSGGCNRLMGVYQLSGNHLTFAQMAGTMMVCAAGMDTEQAFHAALAKVKTWKITGSQLTFFDGDGKKLAVFGPRKQE